jgi:hypothetical protein
VDCIFNLSTALGFSNAVESFDRLSQRGPAELRDLFKVIYVAPDLSSDDYTTLAGLVATGGVIEQFVSMGGVAVINMAGTVGGQSAVAPDGVGFDGSAHNSESIKVPQHPYFTGLGFAGETLTSFNFDGWQPTDFGSLNNLPDGATALLQNSDGGVTLAEYPHGDGRVIVSTLSYCWIGKPDSDGAPAHNLLGYSRFYSGSAQTPAPTVTPTFSPTVTPTRTNTVPPSATATPLPHTASDLDSIIEAIFAGTNPPQDDVNNDGTVTAADIPALLDLLGSQ